MTTPIEPSPKSPAIELFIANAMGKSRITTIENGLCMTCDGKAEEFRNDIDRKEYAISGMCQACQDRVFGVPDD